MMVLLPTIQTVFLQAFRDQDLFFGIGEGLTAWDSGGLPVPGVDEDALVAPLGYKRIRDKRFVVPDVAGVLSVLDGSDVEHKFSVSDVPTSRLYLAVLVDNEEVPYGSFRERSIVSGLVLPPGSPPGKDFYLAEEVSGGVTLGYETHAFVDRHILIQEKFEQIINFS